MKRLLATTAMLFAFSGAHAASLDVPSGAYNMDNTHASLVWKVNHVGLSKYTAKLTVFDIALTLDADNVANSTVSATIDPTSIVTNYPNADTKDFDAELETKWLKSGEFPQITFQSTAIDITGDKTGTMTGDLTFMGVTKPVTMDVTLHAALEKHPFAPGAALGFNATGSFMRSEFGLNNLLGPVSDEVEIIIEAEFVQAQ